MCLHKTFSVMCWAHYDFKENVKLYSITIILPFYTTSSHAVTLSGAALAARFVCTFCKTDAKAMMTMRDHRASGVITYCVAVCSCCLACSGGNCHDELWGDVTTTTTTAAGWREGGLESDLVESSIGVPPRLLVA